MHEFVDCLDQFPSHFLPGDGLRHLLVGHVSLPSVVSISNMPWSGEYVVVRHPDISVLQDRKLPDEVPGGQRCRKLLTRVHPGSDFGNVKRGLNLSGKFARIFDVRDDLQLSPPSRGP